MKKAETVHIISFFVNFFYLSPYISERSGLWILLDSSSWPKPLALWQRTILIWMDFPEGVCWNWTKKGLILSQKRRLTLSSNNFGLPAPKVTCFFSKDRNLKDLSFQLHNFHEQFFMLTKRSWSVLLLRDFYILLRSFKISFFYF